MNQDRRYCNVCRFNQRGFCKYGESCQKKHVNEICQIENCYSNVCEKRHPLVCKWFSLKTGCRFKEGCAFLHLKTREQNNLDTALEQIKEMKIEIQSMKTKIEENELLHDVKKLIDDIRFLQQNNFEITKRIYKLEEDFIEDNYEDESEEDEEVEQDSDIYTCNECELIFYVKQDFKEHKKKVHKEDIDNENMKEFISRLRLKKHVKLFQEYFRKNNFVKVKDFIEKMVSIYGDEFILDFD